MSSPQADDVIPVPVVAVAADAEPVVTTTTDKPEMLPKVEEEAYKHSDDRPATTATVPLQNGQEGSSGTTVLPAEEGILSTAVITFASQQPNLAPAVQTETVPSSNVEEATAGPSTAAQVEVVLPPATVELPPVTQCLPVDVLPSLPAEVLPIPQAPVSSSGIPVHSGDLSAGGTLGGLTDDGMSSAEKLGVSRAAIISEVEGVMQPQFEGMLEEGLVEWHKQLQAQLSLASEQHHKAKEMLKQVDQERAIARDAFRADQSCSEKHRNWKTKVNQLKDSQEHLRVAKEQYYKALAAVECVSKEIKRRTKREAPRRDDLKAAKKRKSGAPEETCPYCGHTYTVRDGLSTKQDGDGNRLHMRKCQCREKTPPCRNCPKCKDNQDIMALNDPNMQFQLCQLRFKCEICACRCPGAGKWVETDGESRKAYAARTSQRHGELNAMGWYNVSGVQALKSSNTAQVVKSAPGMLPAELTKNSKTLKRLPADIRAQMELLQLQVLNSCGVVQVQGAVATPVSVTGAAVSMPVGTAMAVPNSMPSPSPLDVSNCVQCVVAHAAHHMAHMPQPGQAPPQPSPMQVPGPPMNIQTPPPPPAVHTPASQAAAPPPDTGPRTLEKPPPELPVDVMTLVTDVFEAPAGAGAVSAVTSYLQSQRVTAMEDLTFLELDWLCEALQPQGLPPLLLNKFLALAKRRA